MATIHLNKTYKKVDVPGLTIEKKSSKFDFLNNEIKLFNKGLSDKKKENFYSELSILFSAGVDIRAALELIEEEQVKDKALFANIKNAIVSGATLSMAIEQTGMFSAYEYYSLKIAEESGRLTEVLNELSFFFSKKIKQKRQLTSALSYPIIVFVVSISSIFFMMKFVVPMFADVFKRFKGELPYFTQLIINFSNVCADYSIHFFLFTGVVFFVLYSQRKADWFRNYSSKLVLRMPIIKNMISKIYLARFCQSMNLLISAKTPLITAIELVEKMVGFYPIEISLITIRADIERGVPLHSSLAKFKIYNKRMISLIKTAEEVNKLDAMFGKLAEQYSEEVEHQTSILGSLIEPLMIIFLGVLIAIILIAMYLPMFQMSNTMG